MSVCEECHGHDGDCIVLEREPAEAWIEEQLGDIQINLGKVTKPIQGFERMIGEVDFKTLGLNATIIFGDEFSFEDVNEATMMVGRVLRSFYVRTRLLPLLEDTGKGVC